MLQTEWGLTVVVDLFMSGFGGCLFVAMAVLFLAAGERFRRVTRVGAWVSLGAVALGVCSLLADVGQPLRAMWMFGSFVNFDSWMPRGAWSLALTLLVFLLFALLSERKLLRKAGWLEQRGEEEVLKRGVATARRSLAVAGILLGLFVTVYTGCLLEDSASIPFWDSAFLPLSFICTSLAAGSATALMLVVLLADPLERRKAVKAFAASTVGCAVLSAGFVAAYLLNMNGAASAAKASADWVAASPVFIVSVACIVLLAIAGIAVIVFAMRGKGNMKYLAVGACVVAVVAGFAFRFCVVGGGQHADLPSVSVVQMFDGDGYRFQ